MRSALDVDYQRFIGVRELAQILDVDPESIYAKTSKKNRGHLQEEPRSLECGNSSMDKAGATDQMVVARRLRMDRPKDKVWIRQR
jgi:hypothetical protein